MRGFRSFFSPVVVYFFLLPMVRSSLWCGVCECDVIRGAVIRCHYLIAT